MDHGMLLPPIESNPPSLTQNICQPLAEHSTGHMSRPEPQCSAKGQRTFHTRLSDGYQETGRGFLGEKFSALCFQKHNS